MKNKIRGIRDGLDAWRTQPDEIFFFSFLFSLLVEKNCNTSYIRVYVCVCVCFFFFLMLIYQVISFLDFVSFKYPTT